MGKNTDNANCLAGINTTVDSGLMPSTSSQTASARRKPHTFLDEDKVREVLRLHEQGQNPYQIGRLLGISHSTVDSVLSSPDSPCRRAYHYNKQIEQMYLDGMAVEEICRITGRTRRMVLKITLRVRPPMKAWNRCSPQCNDPFTPKERPKARKERPKAEPPWIPPAPPKPKIDWHEYEKHVMWLIEHTGIFNEAYRTLQELLKQTRIKIEQSRTNHQ